MTDNRMTPSKIFHSFMIILFMAGILTACSFIELAMGGAPASCPVTRPDWFKPPEDSAVSGTPEFGHYYVNADESMIASAWWTGQEEEYLRAGDQGLKTGWFRPAGVELVITGYRIDGEAPPLDGHAPCCYPTRFQAAGLLFPTEGCWEVNSKAADSELTFVVWVAPEN